MAEKLQKLPGSSAHAHGQDGRATVRVLLFAALRDAFGAAAIDLNAATIADARRELAARCPAVEGLLSRSRFAVNQQFVDASYRLREGNEIAVIPPVSGG